MAYLPRGFTLIEMLVTMTISVVVMLAVGFLIQYFYQTNAYTLEQTQAVESARRSIQNAVSNLREASYAADGSYPIAAAATSTITFYSDISGTSVLEKVRYYLSGFTFYRGVTEPIGNPPSYAGQPEVVTLVVDNIRNGTSTPLFTYYDSNGTALGAAPVIPSIISVKLTVLTDVNPTRAPTVYTLSAGATLRNLSTQK
jgi:prepilin-type N-terminal cleavage/methylation domain-containing protein